jgi:hypothetical protein
VPQDQLDINSILGKRAAISIDPEETPDEHKARILREQGEARFELIKSYVLLFTLVPAILLLGGFCIYVAQFDSSATVDTKRVAWTMLTSLFTGSVSFVLGQRTAKSK